MFPKFEKNEFWNNRKKIDLENEVMGGVVGNPDFENHPHMQILVKFFAC